MAAGNPTFFQDASEVTRRETTEGVASGQWADGMNAGASNAPGIGINVDGGAVVGEAQQFTLNDQDNAARTPQVSSVVGGPGAAGTEGKPTDPIRAGTNDAGGDGTVTPVDNVWLESLSAGWTEGDPTP